VRHGFITLAGALCFTELAVRFPQAGGEYVYLRHGFGRRVAFLYGWMAAVVMYPGVAAALCVGLVPYVQSLVVFPAGLPPRCRLSFCSRSAHSTTPEPVSPAAS
jgi:APA family basic amino acid/polyamine antiporter